jgi:integrase/recombinase XerD
MRHQLIPDPVFVELNRSKEPPTREATSPIDLRALRIDEFLNARSLAPNSQKAYRRDLKHFLEWCPTPWSSVTPRQITQFKVHLMRKDTQEKRVLSDASVVRILGTLKNFYGWMQRSRHVEFDPTAEVQVPKLKEPTAQNLSDEQVEQILEAVAKTRQPERDLAIFAVLSHGLRATSIALLNVEDYDGQRLFIREDKSDSKGQVPLGKAAQQTLDFYLEWRRGEGEALTPEMPLFITRSRERIAYSTIRKLVDRISEKTGIDFHAHNFRHTFGTNFVLKGMNPYHVMSIMRIKSPSTFKRYTKAAEQAAAEAEFRKFE